MASAHRITLITIAAMLGCATGAAAQSIRVKLVDKGVVRTSMEEYVAWVLAGEAGGMTSNEALKAMAVTVRTYARTNAQRHIREGFDYCETTHCQDARVRGVTARLRAAAMDTEGEILWYKGRPALTFYTGHCGGRTAAAREIWPRAGRPYLPSAEDKFCPANNAWSARIPLETLARALRLPELHELSVNRRTASGRALNLTSDAGLLDAERVHLLVGRAMGWNLLRSRLYNVSVTPDAALFQGTGTGHGVGLCQLGAEARGKAGHDYKKILAAYFPGTRSGVAAQDIPWEVRHGERVDLWATGAAGEEELTAIADTTLDLAERRSGLTITIRPRIRAYPTAALFRDSVAAAGHVSAVTRGYTIHLQPVAQLRSQGIMASTLLHEMLHVVLGVNNPGRSPEEEEKLVQKLAGTTH